MNIKASESRRAIFEIEKEEESDKHRRTQWSKIHDVLLQKLAKDHQEHNWGDVAQKMNESFPEQEFTAKNCSRRWTNCINPRINRSYLNDAEELLLISSHFYFRNQWAKVSEKFPTRNSRVLSDNFYCLLKKIMRRIVMGKKLKQEVTPLLFIQTLYMCIYTIMLIKLPQTPPQKNDMVPLYIYLYLKEIKVTKEMCLSHIEELLNKLSKRFPLKNQISALKKYTYETLSGSFFPALANIIRSNVSASSVITDEFLFDLINKAFELKAFKKPNTSTIPMPSSNFRIPLDSSPQLANSFISKESQGNISNPILCYNPCLQTFNPQPFLQPNFPVYLMYPPNPIIQNQPPKILQMQMQHLSQYMQPLSSQFAFPPLRINKAQESENGNKLFPAKP